MSRLCILTSIQSDSFRIISITKCEAPKIAQIVCSKSSVIFNCEHLPIALSGREVSHPMFSISKKRLLGLAGQWSAGKLSHTENYLLYLSLLDSTNLITWRSPAIFHEKTPQIVSNNMESLLLIIGKIDIIHHPSFALPNFAIGQDTAHLGNSYHWIQTWIQQYNDWYDGYKSAGERERIKDAIDTRETALQRLIKSSHSSPDELANMIANWAQIAGDFPRFRIPHPITSQPVQICEYWKQIIRACAKSESIFKYPKKDIEELLDHCEDNIEPGSIYSNSLFTLLRKGLERQKDYLGFGDVDLAGRRTSFMILPSSSSAEDANIQAAIASAPDREPIASNYPNRFAYLRAKSNWDMKLRYAK